MKQKSAVEYLIDEVVLDLYFDSNIPKEKRDKVLDATLKAREMFKEQIIHAATYGANSPSPEEYYKKTF